MMKSIAGALRFSAPRVLASTLGLCAGLLTGCDVAMTRQPVGEKPAKLSGSHLDGVWRDGEGRPWFLRTVDATNAEFELAFVETKADGFSLNTGRVFVRGDASEGLVASYRGSNAKPDEPYVFGRLFVTEGSMLFAPASPRAIRTLVLDGILGAEMSTNDERNPNPGYQVTVTNGYERLGRILATPEGSRYLDLGRAVSFQKQTEKVD